MASNLYEVEYAEADTSQPPQQQLQSDFDHFWSQTSHNCSKNSCLTVLEDLQPATAYAIRVRAHSADASSLAIGWSNFSASWHCTTESMPANTPGIPIRVGSLSPSSIALRWEAPAAAAAASAQAGPITFSVQMYQAHNSKWVVLASVPAPTVTATLHGLAPAAAYRLRVVAHSATADTAGEPSTLRTADPGVHLLTVWRVTDFLANERTIDFLGDHDGGSADGVSLFMAGNQNNAGWEPFDIREATLAQYCVAVSAAKPFAPYASCNTQTPGKPPSCACENFSDRKIGHQDNATIVRDCGEKGKCTCSNESLAQSRANVGMQPVYWPWPGAWGWGPTGVDGYPQNIPAGMWYSFPAGAECTSSPDQLLSLQDEETASGVAQQEAVSSSDSSSKCSWARYPDAKVVRGSALIAAGWNTSNSTSVKDYHQWSPAREQVLHNAGLMEDAAKALSGAANRCCGC
jgi:hypothetical protein